MTRPLTIAAISYLNTAPLMWAFERNPSELVRRNFRSEYTVPSLCAQKLADGRADLGIIPVIMTRRIPGLRILSDVAIASYAPVRSISLISKVPIEEIRTIAVDTSSRTSVCLLQVLLAKFYGAPTLLYEPSCDAKDLARAGVRHLLPMPPVLGPMLQQADAGLLIGDAALTTLTHGLYFYDLATLWREKTGLPFVFAQWAVRQEALDECDPELDLAQLLSASRDQGLQPESVQLIAQEWAPKLNLSHANVVEYLTKNIHYTLDANCAKGKELFFTYAQELGLI